MTQEQAPARRGLSPLDERLPQPVRDAAQHLRDLRDRIGLTSEDLADRLSTNDIRVDKTRLSKFFNGREIPRLAVTKRLHLVLAELEGTEPDPAQLLQTRRLMYAAAASTRPLQAREFELAEAHEQLEEQRARSLQDLADLQHDLDHERKRREEAEAALEDLTERTREETRALKDERDEALERIAELEGQIRQASAVLRLQDRDAQALDQMVLAADTELHLWEHSANGDLAGICAAVAYLRDADEDETADKLLQQIIHSHPVPEVLDLARTFKAMNRGHDRAALELGLALGRKPIDLFRWLTSQERGSQPYSRFLDIVAYVAPVATLARIHKACEQHGNSNLNWDMLRALTSRSRNLSGTSEYWADHLRRALEIHQDVAARTPEAASAAKEGHL